MITPLVGHARNSSEEKGLTEREERKEKGKGRDRAGRRVSPLALALDAEGS